MRYFLAFLALLSVTSSTVSTLPETHSRTLQSSTVVHVMDGGTPIPKH